MKVLVLSDLHLEFAPFEPAPDLQFDVATLAGDIHSSAAAALEWAADRFRGKPIIQIAGNHEYYQSVMHRELAEMRSRAKELGIHFLDCDEVVISGVRFLGCTLWTDFRLRIENPGFAGQPVRLLSDRQRSMTESARYLADYSAIRIDDPRTSNSRGTRRLVPADTLEIHRRHRSWLRAKLSEPFNGSTAVVTHHAPHRNSLAPPFAGDWLAGGFVNKMPPDFFKVPTLFVHGHTHDSFNYGVGTCRVVCNPRGYLNRKGQFENKDFDPGLVIDVQSCA